MKIKRNGFILFYLIPLICIIILLAFKIFTQTLNVINITQSKLKETKSFYFAESGIELAKSKIFLDNNWYTEDKAVLENKTYLILSTTGQIIMFESGGCKIIREKNKNVLYSIGFLGNDITKSKAYSFQKITFAIPIKTLKWEEL